MFKHWLWEPLRAYFARKRLERLHYEAAAAVFHESTSPERVGEDPDAADWRLVGLAGKQADDDDLRTIRDKARSLADYNPYARNCLTLHRDYVVGTGMRHEIVRGPLSVVHGEVMPEAAPHTTDNGPRTTDAALHTVAALWNDFLAANDWDSGNRKDWEFCLRTWRDGECFLRLFRQATWPPRVYFVDPEHVAPDPKTGLPAGGIETAPGNVEAPVAYWILQEEKPGFRPHASPPHDGSLGSGNPVSGLEVERVEADRILHTKIGVDGNVKRGVSMFLPVLDALKRFQGWLDVELIHRKMASSIVWVRKHPQNYPAGVSSFADSAKTGTTSLEGESLRRFRLQPGTIIDVQGYDLQSLAPNTHFADASILGRTILLSIAAGTGLPEYMLSADASNANYASTLVAEGPAVRHFAAWQTFFTGQWQKLFRMVLAEAVRLGLLSVAESRSISLKITPPPLAVRNRHEDAQADAVYYDRGALSAKELARRDHADPELMQRERKEEAD